MRHLIFNSRRDTKNDNTPLLLRYMRDQMVGLEKVAP